MRLNLDARDRLFIGSLLCFGLFFALTHCSSVPVSPATQEAAVRAALIEADRICQAASPPLPPGPTRDACYVLQNSDEAIILLEQALAPKPDDSPVSGDGGPMNVEQGNTVRAVDGG